MKQEQKKGNGRRLILLLCVAIFTILLYTAFSSEPSMKVEARNIQKEFSPADQEYMEQIEALATDNQQFSESDLARQIEDLQDVLASRDQERAEFEAMVVQLSEVVAQKTEEIEQKQDEILVLQDNLNQRGELEASLEKKREALEQAEKMIQDAHLAVEKLEQQLAEVQYEENQIESLRSQLKRNEQTYQENLDMERDAREELQTTIANYQLQIEDLKTQIAQLEVLRTEIEEKEIQLQDSTDELTAAQNQMEEMKRQLHQKDEMFRTSIEMEENKKQEFRETISYLQEQNNQRTLEAAKIAPLEEQLTAKITEISVAKQALEKAETNIRELQNDLEANATKLAETVHERQILRRALNENAETIESLELQAQNQEQKLASQIDKQHLVKEALEKDLGQHQKRIEQLLARIEGLEMELRIQSDRANELLVFERKYEEEKKKRLIKEQVLKQLQAHLQQQKRSLSEIETNRQNLNDELELTQKSYSQLAKELAKRKPSPGVIQDVVMNVSQQHIVAEGETLMHISKKYYGTTRKWKRILEANRDVIQDENKIRPGTELMIP